MAWTVPNIFTSGTALAAAELNKIRDSLKAIGDPWVSYTPTWTAATTNPTLGNGTLTGKYLAMGKLIICRIDLTIGSTTTLGSGAYSFSLPVTAVAANINFGSTLVQQGSSNNTGGAYVDTTTTVRPMIASGSVTGASPFALATGNLIRVSGMYEAA